MLVVLLAEFGLEWFQKIEGFFEIALGYDFTEELDLFGMKLVLDVGLLLEQEEGFDIAFVLEVAHNGSQAGLLVH